MPKLSSWYETTVMRNMFDDYRLPIDRILDLDEYLLFQFANKIHLRNKKTEEQSDPIAFDDKIISLYKIQKRQDRHRILCVTGSHQL